MGADPGPRMTSVDRRTRFQGDTLDLDPGSFCRQSWPELLREHGRLAARGYRLLDLAPLTLDTDDGPYTLAPADDTLAIAAGKRENGVVVAVDRAAFADMVQDVASTFGLGMQGRAEVRTGSLDEFVAWEPVLRASLDGRPVYEPGTIALRDRGGGPLDLERAFTVDDAIDDMAHFLAEAGFLHLRGVFSADEMDTVIADHDDAISTAQPDDGRSWWARTHDGEHYPARVLGFNHQSSALRELLHDDRFTFIGQISGDAWVQRDPDETDAAEALLKKIGVVEGISDVSWHKDCSLGGHTRSCCGLTVGISLTGADHESGELGVVAGSHRANVQPTGARSDLDLPRLPLPTSVGDLTIHCSCTLHMSRPPVTRGRRVVYTGFDLAPRPDDRVSPTESDDIRAWRASLNDQARQLQSRQDFGVADEMFALDTTPENAHSHDPG